MEPKIKLHSVAWIMLLVALAAAVALNYDAMRRAADVYRNGNPGHTDNAKLMRAWKHSAAARLRLADLRHEAEILDLRRTQLRADSRLAEIQTDRGAVLTGYLNGQTVEIVELKVGLSNKDDVVTFYYDHRRLFFIREIVSHFRYSDKTGAFDFTTPSRVIETDTGVLPSGVVLGGDTPNPSEDPKRSGKRRIASLRSMEIKCARIVRQEPVAVTGRDWTALFED